MRVMIAFPDVMCMLKTMNFATELDLPSQTAVDQNGQGLIGMNLS